MKMKLVQTTNGAMMPYIGVVGELECENNIVYFKFLDEYKQERTLKTTTITGQLGSLEHPKSKEVVYRTKRAEYVFEKTDYQNESLFSYVTDKASNLSQIIPVALVYTSNKNLEPFTGATGQLHILEEGRKFNFAFICGAEKKSIESYITSMDGDLEITESVTFYTQHSMYRFKKL